MSKSSDSSIKITCGGCDATVRVSANQPGARYQCPRCGSVLVAPGASPADLDPPESRGRTAIIIVCPLCKGAQSVPRAKIGSRITCGDCLEEFTVSAEAASAPWVDSAEATEMTTDHHGLDDLFPSVPPASASNSPAFDELFPGGSSTDPAPPPGPASDRDPWPLSSASGQPELYEFTVTCPLCGTRVEATTEQVGERLRCPDCFSDFAVVQPPPSHMRRREKASPADDEELRVRLEPSSGDSAQHDDESWPILSAGPALPAAAPPASFPQEIQRDLAQHYLSKAEEEREERERKMPPLPRAPFRDRIFGFLQEPWAILSAVFLGGGLQIVIGSTLTAIEMFGAGDAVRQFLCILLFIVIGISGLFWGPLFASNALCVLRETSEGRDQIERWPGFNIAENVGDFLYVAFSLFYSVVPGFLLGSLVSAGLQESWPTWAAIGTSVYVLFPVLLLSGLEQGVAFFPMSTAIQTSLAKDSQVWLKFYLISAAVVVAIAGCLGIQLQVGGILGFAAGAGTVILAFLYFRLLGRLTWVCAEADHEPKS